ncbi:hypothetical protein [Catenuloplanes indicus]|uniref:Uncharacterized protein n=1 Tax=Catenuloplanes indicus TaxID=137267 RepID=A0AAE3W8Q6_9ACTN|nr:hypothetical protein [Catenuloplanes indicus]MDQ0370525.1 hypothetical protein [Catenuloplanes indicus]
MRTLLIIGAGLGAIALVLLLAALRAKDPAGRRRLNVIALVVLLVSLVVNVVAALT